MTNLKKELMESEPYSVSFKFTEALNSKSEKAVLDFLIDCTGNPKVKKDGEYIVASHQFIADNTGVSLRTIRGGTLDSLVMKNVISMNNSGTSTTKIKIETEGIEKLRKIYHEKQVVQNCTNDENEVVQNCTSEDELMQNCTSDNEEVVQNCTSASAELHQSLMQNCTTTSAELPISNNILKNVIKNKEKELFPNQYVNKEVQVNESDTVHTDSLHIVEECTNEDLPSDNLHGTGLETGDGKNGTPNPEGAILKDTPQGDETMNTVTENLQYSRANLEKVTKTFEEEYNKTGTIPDYKFFDKVYPKSDFRLYTEAKENVRRYAEFVNPPKNEHTEEELREWERFKPLLDSWAITQEKMNRETMDNLEHPVEGSHYEVINKWVRYYKPQATYLQVMHFLSIFNTAFSRKWLSKDFDPANEPRNIITGYWNDEEAKDYFCLQGMPIDALKGLIKTYGSRLPHFKELASLKDSDLTYHLNCYKAHKG